MAAGGCASKPSVAPSSLYQNLDEPLITIEIFRYLQKQRGVLQADDAANCDPSFFFFIVLSYSGGFAAPVKHFSLQCGPLNNYVGHPCSLLGCKLNTVTLNTARKLLRIFDSTIQRTQLTSFNNFSAKMNKFTGER